MRYFVFHDAVLYVRSNMRRNGFDIRIQSRLGVNYWTEAEYYARPGQIIEVNFNEYPQYNIPFNNVELIPDEGIPIIVAPDVNGHDVHNGQNVIYHEIQPNDRVIIQNDMVMVEHVPENNDQNEVHVEDEIQDNEIDRNDDDQNIQEANNNA